jgi:hypothetical protein
MLSVPLCLSIVAPSTLYLVSQRVTEPDRWVRRMALLPLLILVGVGLALSNSRAIVEALLGMQSGFMRTPKRGNREIKRYTTHLPKLALLEILLGLYSTWTLVQYIEAGRWGVTPFLAIYAGGFLFIGVLTVAQAFGYVGSRDKPAPPEAA